MVKLVRQELVLLVVEGLHEVVVVYKVPYKLDGIVVHKLEDNVRERLSTKSYKESSVKCLIGQRLLQHRDKGRHNVVVVQEGHAQIMDNAQVRVTVEQGQEQVLGNLVLRYQVETRR